MSDTEIEAVSPESDKVADAETDLQVEIVDDTPPEDKNRPRRTGEPDLPEEDEVSQYSDKVKNQVRVPRRTPCERGA